MEKAKADAQQPPAQAQKPANPGLKDDNINPLLNNGITNRDVFSLDP